MADPTPVGSDVSAGTYRCTNCGYELGVQSVQSLPPCPNCEGPYGWEGLSGGATARTIPIRIAIIRRLVRPSVSPPTARSRGCDQGQQQAFAPSAARS